MTTQNKRRDKTKHERRREGRRVDDSAKKQMEEMHEEDERDRKKEMREDDSRGEGDGEGRKKERTNRRVRAEKDRYWGKREKERKWRVSDSSSSSARNCCPEITRTIRSCQDQHTHTHRACTGSYILHQVNTLTHTPIIPSIYETQQNTKHSHALRQLQDSVCALQNFRFISKVSASLVQFLRIQTEY